MGWGRGGVGDWGSRTIRNCLNVACVVIKYGMLSIHLILSAALVEKRRMAYANSNGSDEPAHPHRHTKSYAFRSRKR